MSTSSAGILSAVIVVSGLPRSGTSMMMRCLAAGGLPILTDGLRHPDVDNPHGYFEYEPVRRLADDAAWLAGARGHAVKIIAFLLKYLPGSVDYRLVFMDRDINEVLASQWSMLQRRRGKSTCSKDESTYSKEQIAMRQVYTVHLHEVFAWLEDQRHIKTIIVRYADIVSEPQHTITLVDNFIGAGLDRAAMADAVDVSLYRNRMSQEVSR